MATTHFELVTPEALLLAEEVGLVVVPGVEGDMGIMAGHAPVITSLRPGLVTVHEDIGASPSRGFFVGGGVAEVNGERCLVLAEEAADLADLSRDQAAARCSEAEAARAAASSKAEQAQADTELALANAQLAALNEGNSYIKLAN